MKEYELQELVLLQLKGDDMKPLTEAQKKVLRNTPDEELTTVFSGYTRGFLRTQKRNLPDEVVEIETDRTVRKLKESTSLISRKNKLLQDKVDGLENLVEEAFKIKESPQVFKIKDASVSPESATAFMVASDWHIEEEVRKESVNGLNFYNLEESKLRSERFFANGVYLLKLAQKHSDIKTLVLPLLGDFITNSLRDENLENNLLLPGDALWRVKSYLISGIKHILENTDVNITVPCHTGNHGRMTEKIHVATEDGNSLERYMYRNLAEYFEDDPRVTFIITEGGISYIKVYEKTTRLMHGHSFKSGGGVGGITIPIRKGIMQLNKSKWADLTIMGHFHQLLFMEDLIVNGSLIGWNTFAQWIKADYEPPRQAFFVMHSHGGGTKTLMSPIWLDKTK